MVNAPLRRTLRPVLEGSDTATFALEWRGAMRIARRYTVKGLSPYSGIEFQIRKSEIRNPDGSVAFALDHVEVPATWSQVATDVLAQRYFRKADVPARRKRVREAGVPLW